MAKKEWEDYAKNYFKRFASPEPILPLPPPMRSMVSAIVVIPCCNEPDLIGTLDSLTDCDGYWNWVEVIVVVNHAENAPDSVKEQNQKTIREFHAWNEVYKKRWDKYAVAKPSQLFLIEALDLPFKHAGVGLARKIGMDEALRRFIEHGIDGSIVCLDADCRVSRNYLPQVAGFSGNLGYVRYEHRWQEVEDPKLRSGIIFYELFLRYYVEGLRQAGFPHAIQTVGSCMVVRAHTYAKYQGMNRRKAGEDFYFLHRIAPHENLEQLSEITVYPSCRTSDRVPFGTGKAQQDWLNQESGEYLTYDPVIFKELKALLNQVPAFFASSLEGLLPTLSEINQHFLTEHNCLEKIALIKTNTVNEVQFVKQFYIWFDGFMCMKYVHFLRDRYYPNQAIEKVAALLIGLEPTNATELLKRYRLIDLAH